MKKTALLLALLLPCLGCYVTSSELKEVQRDWSEAMASGDEAARKDAEIKLGQLIREQEAFEEALRQLQAAAPGVLGSLGTPQGITGAITAIGGAMAAYVAARKKAESIAAQQKEIVKMEINAERDRKYVDKAKAMSVSQDQKTS